MEKINFINDTTPALNATNLNKLQDNVEDEIDITNSNVTSLSTNKLDKTSVKDTYSTSATDTYSCNYVNQIVESGNNENGNWIKYVNGDLICYGTASIQNPTYSGWYSFCRVTNDATVTLPAAFKDNAYKIAATSFTFGYFSMIIRNKNTDSFTFKGCTHNQDTYNPGSGTFDYVAVGKWK